MFPLQLTVVVTQVFSNLTACDLRGQKQSPCNLTFSWQSPFLELEVRM
jgi:hypothetical protein